MTDGQIISDSRHHGHGWQCWEHMCLRVRALPQIFDVVQFTRQLFYSNLLLTCSRNRLLVATLVTSTSPARNTHITSFDARVQIISHLFHNAIVCAQIIVANHYCFRCEFSHISIGPKKSEIGSMQKLKVISSHIVQWNAIRPHKQVIYSIEMKTNRERAALFY